MIDRVFMEAIRWPSRDKLGRPNNNLPMLEDILSLMEERFTRSYRFGEAVWSKLAYQCHLGSDLDKARKRMVVRTLKGFFMDWRTCVVGERLIAMGLDACDYTNQAPLAVDLIGRALAPKKGSNSGPLVDPRYLQQAMDICVRAGRKSLSRTLLDFIVQRGCPEAQLLPIILSCFQLHAKAGETEWCERLILRMHKLGLRPGYVTLWGITSTHTLKGLLSKPGSYRLIAVGDSSIMPRRYLIRSNPPT